MDRIVNKIAGLGVPGIMLMVAISMTGLSGAAAITAALALLGPGGMLGGIAFLLLAGAVTSALTEFGFDALFKAVIKKLYKNGETKETIRRKSRKDLGQRNLRQRQSLIWKNFSINV